MLQSWWFVRKVSYLVACSDVCWFKFRNHYIPALHFEIHLFIKLKCFKKLVIDPTYIFINMNLKLKVCLPNFLIQTSGLVIFSFERQFSRILYMPGKINVPALCIRNNDSRIYRQWKFEPDPIDAKCILIISLLIAFWLECRAWWFQF